MTIATHWYDQPCKKARSFEAHFKVARQGNIRTVRKKLADKGVPFFQRVIRQRHGISIPKDKMRTAFEREEPALEVQNDIHVEFRGMEFRGKHHFAVSAPSQTLKYEREPDKHEQSERA